MPLVTCPACDYEQVVPREMTGLEVRCGKCGAEFPAMDAAPASRSRQPEPVAVGEPISAVTILKSVGLVAGLVLAVGLVLLLIIWMVRTPTPKATPTQPTARSSAEARVERLQEQRREAEEVQRRKLDETDKKIEQATRRGVKLFIVAAVGVYGLFVLALGGWLARDASGRGMSALGWASFYYLFHLIARLAVLPLAVIPAFVLFTEVGSAIVVAGEPAAWTGLFVYLVARRSGRLGRCNHCRNARLEYLVRCPICGARE